VLRWQAYRPPPVFPGTGTCATLRLSTGRRVAARLGARHARVTEILQKLVAAGCRVGYDVCMTTTTATVHLIDQFAANGRYIRKATQVRFATGETVTFMERMPKGRAIQVATRWVADGLADGREG
jgi:hypothetical protein